MRADRLVATLLMLQAHTRITARELAQELEVSVATARRDLEALSAAGVPVYPQPGRGGGWSLVGGSRTDLTGLTSNEAQALFLLAGPAAATSPGATSALRKLVQALPAPFRADAQAAGRAVVVDPASWGGGERSRPELVDRLQAAVVGRRKVSFEYTNRTGEPSSWLVDPLGLIDKDDVWYLVAETEAGERTFRLTRMGRTEITDLPAVRPEGFDLAGAWQRVVDEVEQRRSLLSAVVVVETGLVPVLYRQFGRHCHPEAELEDGRSRLRVAAPTALMVAQHLAGWGATVEVIEPEAVRTELARIGAELTSRYPSGLRPAP